MTETEYAHKLAEIDRLLNDPGVPLQPSRVWALLAETARRDLDLADAGSHSVADVSSLRLPTRPRT
jgi:hypothetical protein